MKISIFLVGLFFGLGYLQELPPKFRLPNNAVPKSYSLKLIPAIKETNFTGQVTIFVEVKSSIRNITLNSKRLRILNLVLDNCLNTTGYEILTEYEILNIFYTDKEYIDPGEHMIYIKFEGNQTFNSTGIFKTYFPSTRSLVSIATMFSAAYAREAFPCFDEPAYKSEFTVRLVKQFEEYTVLSNTEEIGSFKTEDGVAVDFRTTPPISPYLLCFVLTKLNYSTTSFESKDGRIVPLRIFLLDEYLDQASFLLEVAKNALKYFEEYTNLTYPVSKLDFIEVEGFIFQGMENIGLIILSHNLVSFNESLDVSKIAHQRDAATLIVHEIAHMWFGDIVTQKWYNDLWLTEGFAEYMEIQGLSNQYPDWQLVEEEAALRHTFAYNKDTGANLNYPVINFPKTNDQIEELFSDLTYSKGAAILTMLENVLGKTNFKQGVKNYLKNFYFGVTTTGDFINSMQQMTPYLNLWMFIETWLYQEQYPVIVISSYNSSNTYSLRQYRFYFASDNRSTFGRTWTIPVTYRSSCSESVKLVWFDKDANPVNLTRCKDEKWMKLNYGAVGYYRVLYTSDQYINLIKYFNELPEVDQANLIDETFQLTQRFLISCEIPLRLIGKLKGKSAVLPILISLKAFKTLLVDIHEKLLLREKIRNYFIKIFENLYHELSWQVLDEEKHSERLLRSALFNFICGNYINFTRCYNDTETIRLKGGTIHPDLNFILKKIRQPEDNPSNISVKNILENLIPSSVGHQTTTNYVDLCSPWIIQNLN